MTLRPNEPELPGWKPDPCADESSPGDEGRDQRHALTRLADRILTSWGNTFRALVVTVVVIGVITVALWLLDIEVELGPLHITRR